MKLATRHFPAIAALAALSLFPMAQALAQAVDAAELVRRTTRAVVLIRTFDSRGEETGLGSGFIIPGGRVVTNAHVVAGAARAEIHDSENRLLGVVDHAEAMSTRTDIAVLPRLVTAPASLPLAASEPAVGTRVYAFGSPLGLSNTISDGIVSGFREFDGVRRMQITAPIGRGSSGGPIVDEQGRVVGVSVSYIDGGQNLNFAVPSNEVRALISSPPSRYAFIAAPGRAQGNTSSTNSRDPVTRSVRLGESVVGRLAPSEYTDDGIHYAFYLFDGQRGQAVTIRVTSRIDTKASLGYLDEDGAAHTVAEDDDSGGDLNPLISAVLPHTLRYYILVKNYKPEETGTFRLALTPTAPVTAATTRDPRWVVSSGNDEFLTFIDRTSVRNNRGLVTGWVLWEFSSRQIMSWATYDTELEHVEVECSRRRSRTLQTTYRLDGRVTRTVDSETQWRAAVPGSVGEGNIRQLCRLAGLPYQ